MSASFSSAVAAYKRRFAELSKQLLASQQKAQAIEKKYQDLETQRIETDRENTQLKKKTVDQMLELEQVKEERDQVNKEWRRVAKLFQDEDQA